MLYSRRRKHFTEYRPYMHTNRPIPWEEILKIGKRNHVLFVILDFSNIYLSGFKIICSFHKDERKACVTGLKYLIQNTHYSSLHLLLENEEWLKSSARTRYHIANEASNVSTKWKENHTPPVLIDYETDLQQYDRKLCPTLERGSFSL